MSDELLRYYNSELAFLRKMGNDFAEAHSAIAGHLKLGSEAEHDPHVGRLVQAFAYLNARTRRKLEDDFPEISASMLEVMLSSMKKTICPGRRTRCTSSMTRSTDRWLCVEPK